MSNNNNSLSNTSLDKNYINLNQSGFINNIMDIKHTLNIDTFINNHTSIINIKNNCYINVVLQNLLHISIFIKEFLLKIENISDKENSVSYKFFQIIIEIEKSTNKNKPIDISQFLYFFGLKHEGFNGYSQNDVEEFMIIFFLLEDINRDLNNIKNKPPYKEFQYNDNKSKIEIHKDFNIFCLRYENSIIVDLFYIQLLTIYTCKCGKNYIGFKKY